MLYRNFKALKFKPHKIDPLNRVAQMFFPNGYGISVVSNNILNYKDNYFDEDIWEVAVLKGTEDNYQLCYDTEITDNVISDLTKDDVTELMQRISAL